MYRLPVNGVVHYHEQIASGADGSLCGSHMYFIKLPLAEMNHAAIDSALANSGTGEMLGAGKCSALFQPVDGGVSHF